ncbi:MAG: hypothetical protein VYE73_06910 [Acidobacteriota bacterium]|nr:hypothetical protein [Acidobacteriota bacterium]
MELNAPCAVGVVVLLVGVVACQRERVAPATPDDQPPVSAQAAVDRAVASTGDRLEFSLEVQYGPGYEIEIDEIADDIEGFRLLDLGSVSGTVRGRKQRRDTYVLRADLIGSYILPPVKVRFRKQSAAGGELGGWQEIETSRIFVEIESVVARDADATDVRDIKPIREIDAPFPWYGWIGIGVGLVGAAIAGFLWWRGRRRQVVATPPIPAHIVALEALQRLRHGELGDAEAIRLLHFALSEVVRAYVEGRFALNATDLTTEEILDVAPSLELSEEDLGRLGSILTDSDQVKFARHEPGSEDISSIFERSLTFVGSTLPRAVADDNGGGADQEPAP